MRVVVLSGKGGTGKSCVVSSLAVELSRKRKLVLIDADADCPNQHIIFPGRRVKREKLYVSKIAVVNYRKCNLCRKCLEACQFGALKAEKRVKVDKLRCEGCGACVLACPNGAVRLAPKLSGEMFVRETKRFPLVYGRLVPSESGSGKIVHELRKEGDELAREREAELVLVDAPAGIGCPVIAAVAGCDYAIGVLEPTPAGMKNLERALEMVEYFRIPYYIVMNKVGISKKNEDEAVKKFGKRIAGMIPYDEEIPHLIAEGIPPVLGEGKAAESFRKLAGELERLLF
ncbi:MAG: ATP-binding protein [Candidatus Micrarchaeia archaeon]